MKSAIVLGLALAASAQVDNELVSGADLVRNAGWGRSNPTGTRVPIDYNTKYLNKYGLTHDDAADDEMMVYYTKDSRGVNHYQGGYTRDDAADDELIIAPTDEFGNIKKYPRNVRFDEVADDEMMVYYTKDSRGVNHYQGGYTRDDAADDELVSLPYSPSGADLVKYAKQSQQTVYRPTAHVVRDDEADDEMMVYYTKDSRGVNHYQGGYTRDDEADDEMMVYYTKDSRGVNHYQGGYTRDDAADDELVSLPYSPSGADLVKYAKQSQQTVYRPTAHVVRDDADDEFMVYYTKDSRGVKHYEGGYTRDDADDELAYLGHLIKETAQPEKVEKKPEIKRKFRPVEKN